MSETITVFPSVGALTIEVDYESLYIRQVDDSQQSIEGIDIPRVLLPVFAETLFRELHGDELKEIGRALSAAKRALLRRGAQSG